MPRRCRCPRASGPTASRRGSSRARGRARRSRRLTASRRRCPPQPGQPGSSRRAWRSSPGAPPCPRAARARSPSGRRTPAARPARPQARFGRLPQPVVKRAHLGNTDGDDTRLLAMPLARGSRLLSLRPHAVLRRAHLVRDALVRIGDAPYVVEDVERVREARGGEQERERVGPILAVETCRRDRQAGARRWRAGAAAGSAVPSGAGTARSAAGGAPGAARARARGTRGRSRCRSPRWARARISDDDGLHFGAERLFSLLGLRDLFPERRDLRVDGLFAIDDRIRAGRAAATTASTSTRAARRTMRRRSPVGPTTLPRVFEAYSSAFIARAASARSGATSAR